VKIQVFLNSALEGSEWLASRINLFHAREFPPGNHKQFETGRAKGIKERTQLFIKRHSFFWRTDRPSYLNLKEKVESPLAETYVFRHG
jgi:hypothetical protein